jgi:hypothetical protein
MDALILRIIKNLDHFIKKSKNKDKNKKMVNILFIKYIDVKLAVIFILRVYNNV